MYFLKVKTDNHLKSDKNELAYHSQKSEPLTNGKLKALKQERKGLPLPEVRTRVRRDRWESLRFGCRQRPERTKVCYLDQELENGDVNLPLRQVVQ